MALVSAAVALLAAPVAFAAPPANDNFASATPINPEYDVLDGQPTAEATMEAGEPTVVDGASVSHSIWYSWTSPYFGTARIAACIDNPSAINPTVAVYTGNAVNALTKVGTSQPSTGCREVAFNVTAGTTYHAAAYGIDNTSGNVLVVLDQDITAAPPGNDNFANAARLAPGAPSAAGGTNRGATVEAGEPQHDVAGSNDAPLATVWYAWTPTATGPTTVALCGSNFDTVLDVFTPGSVQLTPVAANDNNCASNRSTVTFDPQCGRTYYMRIGGGIQSVFPARGDINLQITLDPAGGICPTGGGGGGGGTGGGGAGGGTALLAGNCANVQRGTAGNNVLTGTSAGDRISGRGGRDRISGLAGNDCLSGGSGNDSLSGGRGRDRLNGGRGRDRFSGGPGADVIDSRDGRRETVRCSGGRDRVKADRSDRLIGCERVRRA